MLASWLIRQRLSIETSMAERLGPAAPRPSGPEAEALRRFRSYVSTALMRSVTTPPALDGLRPNERRVMALLGAWVEAAAVRAGPSGAEVRAALLPLLEQFRVAIRGSASGRRASGRPRAARRAVSAAIDRIAEAFLAVDVDGLDIVDANPAAGALLGLERDALLGLELQRFVPEAGQAAWWAALDALAEGVESLRVALPLADVRGLPVELDAGLTRFANRSRTLALILLRPALAVADARPRSTPQDSGPDHAPPAAPAPTRGTRGDGARPGPVGYLAKPTD